MSGAMRIEPTHWQAWLRPCKRPRRSKVLGGTFSRAASLSYLLVANAMMEPLKASRPNLYNTAHIVAVSKNVRGGGDWPRSKLDCDDILMPRI